MRPGSVRFLDLATRRCSYQRFVAFFPSCTIAVAVVIGTACRVAQLSSASAPPSSSSDVMSRRCQHGWRKWPLVNFSETLWRSSSRVCHFYSAVRRNQILSCERSTHGAASCDKAQLYISCAYADSRTMCHVICRVPRCLGPTYLLVE